MFYIKQNDTSPAIRATLKRPLADGTEAVVNLTGASVRFLMSRECDSEAKVAAAGSIVNAEGGIVEYQWVAGDTDTADTFRAEFEVTYSDNTIETFPNRAYQHVRIAPELG